ncbi:PIN domain-containing protein (plasmid) [Thermus thermophilus]|uniref:PIN domain-containing protein n=1 Tax=Thermus thermophilus TaxID=274 RepID=UPI001C764E22|nr:hypothetical protein TthAK1_22780 [Thermus thermophilus]
MPSAGPGASKRPLIFLDANILFSASLGGEVFEAIWEGARRKRYRMATSLYCLLEARENLLRKRPTALRELEDKLKVVTLVPEAEGASWMASLVPEKDLPVLAAAVAAGASVLLTGDTRHFKSLMSRQDLPLKVLTPRAFVLTFRPGD